MSTAGVAQPESLGGDSESRFRHVPGRRADDLHHTLVEPPTRDAWVAGSVEVAESFFGDQRVGDFTVGVTRGEAGHEPIEAAT
jgi:hypothetical protein